MRTIVIQNGEDEKHTVIWDGKFLEISNDLAAMGLSMSKESAIRIAAAIEMILGPEPGAEQQAPVCGD
jgi:hypothetical protein